MNRFAPTVLALAVVGLVGCERTTVDLDGAATSSGADRIEMHDNAFLPPVVEVPVGTTLTWAFTDDGRAHNVVGDDFESEVLSDGTFSHTFARLGTHDYTCTLHSGMDGRVVVTGEA